MTALYDYLAPLTDWIPPEILALVRSIASHFSASVR